MCEMCSTNALISEIQIIPGYYVVKAQKDWEHIKAGYYGISDGSSYVLTIPEKPFMDPFFGLDDEKIDENDPNWNINFKFFDLAERILEMNKMDPLDGFRFIGNCIIYGYDPKVDGSNWAAWILHLTAKFIEFCKDNNVYWFEAPSGARDPNAYNKL